MLDARQSEKFRVQIDAVDLKGMIARQQSRVLARAAGHVEHRSRAGVFRANASRDVGRLCRVVLEGEIDRVVQLGGFSEQRALGWIWPATSDGPAGNSARSRHQSSRAAWAPRTAPRTGA